MRLHFLRMFRYVAWADRRVLENLRANSFVQIETVPLFSHILAAEHVWLSRLNEVVPSLLVWPELTLAECETLAKQNEDGYMEFLERTEESRFADMLRYRNNQGVEAENSIIDMLTQVVTHGPYHRGQIAKAISKAGGVAVNTDYIMYIREMNSNV